MKFERLSREYATLWDSMEITRLHKSIERTAARIVQHRARYEVVQSATRVPWYVVGIIHALETGLRFDRHLHNGDPLTARTRLVPAGRPRGQAPFTFEQSCQDALCMKGYDALPDWTIERICWALENYNGWGYRRYHPKTLSPYLWSGANHYRAGKYVADGKWSSSAVSSQAGAMPLLREIMRLCADVRPVSMYDATADPTETSPASNSSADEKSQAPAVTAGTVAGSIGFNLMAGDPVGMTGAAVALKGNVGALMSGVDLALWSVPLLAGAAAVAYIWWVRR